MSLLRTRSARMTGLLATATAVAAGLAGTVPAHALTGPEAAAGQHPAVVKLSIGDEANSRSCTGTLVDEWWIATAASCFAATPGQQVHPRRGRRDVAHHHGQGHRRHLQG
ncbi:trypsin-like serine protease [Streptomyces sp. NRRL F-2747]|uniref:trypsin-like serine protease n=1 Tax=Streptomyces sp. NRRL F-2747 TaxID=1463843 RepID=UPI0004CBFCDA|nr:trypsin-like serine protease [Streptomyces sp. NRRL F-2747]